MFERFLVRLELRDLVARILEGAEYIRSETKLRDGIIRVRN